MPQTGEQLRQRYASDPAYREKKKALARAYGQAHRDAIRGRRAARYDADVSGYRAKARDRAAQHRHGVTQVQKDAMIVDQGGVCAACKIDFMYVSERHQHVDHNHATNKVRGILCHNCNIALGQVKDSQERLYLLIDYLRRTDGPTSGLTFVLETATGQAVEVTAPADRFAAVDTAQGDW